MTAPLIIAVPLRTVSETNMREPWQARHRRRKLQRAAVGLAVRAALAGARVMPPCIVTLTRIAPSSGLDDDNVRGALKAPRDGVADALGVNDRDSRVRWDYAQRRGAYGVEIRVEAA